MTCSLFIREEGEQGQSEMKRRKAGKINFRALPQIRKLFVGFPS
jgi:hypothetical protein